MRSKYEIACLNLYKAIDIAIESLEKYPPKIWNKENLIHVINLYKEFKVGRINAEKKFQTLSSLKYDYDNVFTYFQESTGPDVEEFWRLIKENTLPFKRENKLAKILKRKKIKNDLEYDFAIDVIVPYQQEGLINEEEVALLNQYIGDFESRKKSK